MRCTCCGRWTVEEIVMQDVPGGRRYTRLRIKDGPYHVGDYQYPWEVVAALEREGVLDKMEDVEA